MNILALHQMAGPCLHITVNNDLISNDKVILEIHKLLFFSRNVLVMCSVCVV